MKALRTSIILAAVGAGIACPGTQPAIQAESATPPLALTAAGFEAFADREVQEPQFVLGASGCLLVLWREKAAAGSNLSAAAPSMKGHVSYAAITPETIVEHNLTAAQGASVCGCCRPFIGHDASRLLEQDAVTGATSALLADRKLWLIGAVGGQLMHFERGAR